MRPRAAGLLCRLVATASTGASSSSTNTPRLAAATRAASTRASPSSSSQRLAALAATAGLAAAAAALLPATFPSAASADLSRLARDVEQRLSGLTAEEVATIRLFEQAAPSVVAVTNLRSFRFFRLSVDDVAVGTGSGFVWDKKGRVVTNFHVVKGATHVLVTLLDGTELRAEVVGTDPEKDIAVLQLLPPAAPAAAAPEAAAAGANNNGKGKASKTTAATATPAAAATPAATAAPGPHPCLPPLTPIVPGSSSTLLVGQRVYAIGAPLGLDHTLSTGSVSALGRQIPGGGGDGGAASSSQPISNVIQTDASGVNPGSSGGPLLDSRGRTVGVLCAIADPSGRGSNAGIAFAIPIDTVAGVVRQIIEHGRVVRPSLGVAVAPGSFARRLTSGEVEGVLLLQVPEGSPAAEAGLRGCAGGGCRAGAGAGGSGVGDVIVALDGKPTPDVAELMEALDEKAVGQVVEVRIARYHAPGPGGEAGGALAPGGEWRWATVKVRLGERGVAGTAVE